MIIHNTSKVNPPPAFLPVLEKTKALYKEWQRLSNNFSKPFRFGLGGKIKHLFIEILQGQFEAQFTKIETKEKILVETILKFDFLKFFLQVSWENGYIKESLYGHMLIKLNEIGKELSGWKSFIEKKNSRQS